MNQGVEQREQTRDPERVQAIVVRCLAISPLFAPEVMP